MSTKSIYSKMAVLKAKRLDGNYYTLMCAEDVQLELNTALVEITTRGSGGWAEYAYDGTKNWKFSSNNVTLISDADNAFTIQELQKMQVEKTLLDVQFTLTDISGGVKQYSGKCALSNSTISAAMADGGTFAKSSITLQGSGVLSGISNSVYMPAPTLTANDTANTLSASVSGGYTIQYRTNGGAWITYSSIINVGDVDRPANYYTFRATDGSNYSSIVGSPAFTQAVVSIPVPTLTADDTANTLSANVSGGYTIQYRTNGGAWITYSSIINVGDVDRAANYYTFRATDGTNYSSIIGSPAFTQAVVSIPVPTLTANDTANTLSASVSGGYTIQYRENGGAWSTYSSTINVGDVDRAAGYYEFRATDGTSYSSIIGSPAFTQAVVSIPVPTLTADDTANTISATVSGGYTIQYNENNNGWVTYNGMMNVGDVNRAAGYWRFRATDGTNYSSIVNSPAFTVAVVVDCDPHWDNVISLLRFNGVDNSSNFIDEKGLTITQIGAPVISTAQSKWGGSSLYFDGNSYLEVPIATTLGSGDFTVEGWFRFSSTTQQYVLGKNYYNTSFGIYLHNQKLTLTTNTADNFINQQLIAYEWYHLAVIRSAGKMKLAINGILYLDITNSSEMSDSFIKVGNAWGSQSESFSGYIDDFRITKGVARYTADFTPPTKQFPNVGCGAQPPVIPVPVLAADDNYNTLAATAAGYTIQYQENNGSWNNYTSTINVGDVNRAAGYWKFRATDGTNYSSIVNSPAFTVASVSIPAPTITGDDVSNTLTATVTGGYTIQVQENGGSWINYSGTISVGDVDRAAGYWKFRATDNNGNYSTTVNSPAFTKVYVEPPNVSQNGGRNRLGISVSGSNKAQVRKNGGAWENVIGDYVYVGMGYVPENYYEVRATDNNGHYSTVWTNQFAFEADANPVPLTPLYTNNNLTWNENQNPIFPKSFLFETIYGDVYVRKNAASSWMRVGTGTGVQGWQPPALPAGQGYAEGAFQFIVVDDNGYSSTIANSPASYAY